MVGGQLHATTTTSACVTVCLHRTLCWEASEALSRQAGRAHRGRAPHLDLPRHVDEQLLSLLQACARLQALQGRP